jgi:putative peptidoglycan lipid II flippase
VGFDAFGYASPVTVRDDHHQSESRHQETGHTLSGAIRAFSGVTLLSRIGGLVRDVLLVHIFGNSAIGTAFMAGFTIPNLFRRLFGEGALSAAFIPEYAGADKVGRGHADRLASLTIFWLGMVTGAITLAIELGLLIAILLLPPDPTRDLSLRLIMIMLPFMPLICITAILAGMLQVHGRFGPSASGPLVLNGFIIAVGCWHLATGDKGGAAEAYALGAATVLSGLTQALWFAWLLRRQVRWTVAFGEAREAGRRMIRKMIPVLIGLGTLQASTLLDQLICMWPILVGPMVFGLVYPLDESSGIILAASQRLYQFPLGVFGIAVATAAFPMLSRHAGDGPMFAATLRRGIRLSLFIGLPASVGLVLVRDDLVSVLYSIGADKGFDPGALRRASLVVLGYAPGIWAYSLNQVLTRAFYAKGDTSSPMRLSMIMVGVNLMLNLALIWPMREAGLGWSTSLCAAVQCLILARWCRPLLPAGERLMDGATLAAALRVAAASAVMGVVVALGAWALPTRHSWPAHAASLAGLTLAGGLTYLAAARAFALPELRWLLGLKRAAPVDRATTVD